MYIEDRDGFEMPVDDSWREDEWQEGIHTDRQDNEYKLSEMSDSHLKNTINYFKGLDISPLEKELKSRVK